MRVFDWILVAVLVANLVGLIIAEIRLRRVRRIQRDIWRSTGGRDG